MMRRIGIVLCLLSVTSLWISCNSNEEQHVNRIDIPAIQKLVAGGQFDEAKAAINAALANDPTPQEKASLTFEMDCMQRIRRDFQASSEEVLVYIKDYYPEVTPADMARWEASRALEFRIIEGEKKYFNRAARNLFRIDREMNALWDRLHPDSELSSGSGAKLVLDEHNQAIIKAVGLKTSPYALPKRIRITQSLEVNADVLPAGELLRCWIPFPRLIPGRQESIDLMMTEPVEHILAPEDNLQRTIYFEKPAEAGLPTRFEVQYEMTAYGSHHAIDPEKVTALQDPEGFAEYLQERPPHIVFTPRLKALSDSIVGQEQNPYRQAQRLFAWVDEHIPWASAREYSTIRCIPEYAVENGHGDCGIQTLLFMTLCRIQGIPTRWQSGWELQPPDDSMHDWGLIYFEPYGWVPMDVTYGLRKSEDPALKWFYLSGMDSYRIIFNDDISQPFFPAKQHLRSETVDSQRGEVEWSEGNLYFNDWSWIFDWEIIE